MTTRTIYSYYNTNVCTYIHMDTCMYIMASLPINGYHNSIETDPICDRELSVVKPYGI